MSRRAAIIEEEFDDDTDLPLPGLPNTGSRGPLLQQLGSDDEESDSDDQRAGPASPHNRPQFPGSSTQDRTGKVTDITPYKTWTCIYPIYLDAKRPYGTGQRRVARAKALWWPLSKDIAEAANRLGLGTLHEVNKAHPRDWENPGRVRVQWKKNGKLVNPAVKTKKQLLEMISFQIQHLKPECIPRPPYTLASSSDPTVTAPANPTATSASSKGKQPLTTKANPTTASSNVKQAPPAPATNTRGQKGEKAKEPTVKKAHRSLPVPPEPLPPLTSRLSPYSPALSTGVLLETIKAGMNATETPGLPGMGGPGGGMAKGKRKVVRVRG
ncbi:signal recognition particle protein [Coprinopsis cinerea okayama7|uniref:Signal recognition particle protein n=1 Tax=Coprinopsis cinerea (strain Okayama-7 / 130 / ATCC MYA-4618 / FGSC 9003) TaxID=240176 RepID=A8PCH3_COPC7|nr:signal recognition particle protein [Coprinopsis cinerea okayama7\|eukprot:XP_001840397.2 signal recognition particle protein [Coprinopsis cinerea okayama7\